MNTINKIEARVYPSTLFKQDYPQLNYLLQDKRYQYWNTFLYLDIYLNNNLMNDHKNFIHQFYNVITIEGIDTEKEYDIPRSIFKYLGNKTLCFVINYSLINGYMNIEDDIALTAISDGDKYSLANYYQKNYGFDIILVYSWSNAIAMKSSIVNIIKHCS